MGHEDVAVALDDDASTDAPGTPADPALAPDLAATPAWWTAFDHMFTHHKTYVGDVPLHYVRGGQGAPLILVHGWPTTWYEWRRVMPALAAHFDVIAVDTRGLGDSSRPLSGYDKKTLAADIAGLARELGLGPVHIAGHDLGGQIAYAFAMDHPELTRRIAILDVPLPGLDGWEDVQYWHFRLQETPDIPEMLVAGKEREYLTYFYAQVAHNPAAFTAADIDEFLRTYTQPGAMRAGFAYYRAFQADAQVNRADAAAGQTLRMPVLWLGGASATNDLLGRQLRAVAPDLRGAVIAGCGHWLSTECPRQTSQRLIDFFSGQ